MPSRLAPSVTTRPPDKMKNTANVFASIGCLTLLTFLVVYTSSTNIFLIWDAKAFGYLATCAGLMIAAVVGTVLLAVDKPSTSGPAVTVLLLTALITQFLFGFDLHSVLAVGPLYVAALVELCALLADTTEEPQQ
jgi:hypothetical protein